MKKEIYAAVCHGQNQISVDLLIGGKYVCQETGYYSSRGAALEALRRLCEQDGAEPFSSHVISYEDIKRVKKCRP